MILIAIGANIAGTFGSAMQTVHAVPYLLSNHGVFPTAGSYVYSTSSIGVCGQPQYLNCVIGVESLLSPEFLMSTLKSIEFLAGRCEGPRWSSRPLDLDLLAYHDVISTSSAGSVHPLMYVSSSVRRPFLVLPHPLIDERPFVIRPLLDIAPHWRHPLTHETIHCMWHGVCQKEEGRILARHSQLLSTKT